MKIKHNRKSKRHGKFQKSHTVETLSKEQIEAISAIDNARDKALISLLLQTGLRVSELTNLSYGDVFTDIRSKKGADFVRIVGKGNKERVIALNSTAKDNVLDIDRYNRETLSLTGITKYTPLLVSRTGSRLSPRSIQAIVADNIDSHPHVLRHTCFTQMLQAGVDGTVIQKVAGHSDYNTTVKYYLGITKDDIQGAFAQIDQTPEDNTSPLKLVQNK